MTEVQTDMAARDVSLTVIGTGSSGNGYILDCGGDKLLLECGMPLKKVLEALEYDIRGVCGVLVSHEHGDHAAYLPRYADFFAVYGNETLFRRYNTKVTCLKPRKRKKIGNFDIIPLPVPHGECENYAYIIRHAMMGVMLFCTDAEKCPYKIAKLENAIIECNYVMERVIDKMDSNEEIRSSYQTHMELSGTIDFVRKNDERLRNIILIHKSSSNFDEREVRSRFKKETCRDVIIASCGDKINLGDDF